MRRLILLLVVIAGIAPAFAQAPAPVPALPDAERRTAYSILGSTCACAVGFQIYGDNTDFASWVEVYINGVRVNYNDPTFGWTITSPSGPLASLPRPISDAVLTFTSAQTGTVQIVGARRPRRISQFAENAGVSAHNLNQAFSDLVAQNREVWDKINDVTGRGLFSPPGNAMGPLPLPAQCPNNYLAFDTTGLNPKCQAPTPAQVVSSSTANAVSVRGLFSQPGNAMVPLPLPAQCSNSYLAFDITGVNPKCQAATPAQVVISSTAANAVSVLGRLTLAANTPIMTPTSCSGGQCTGQQILYFAPDGGMFIPVYDGTIQSLYQYTSSPTDTGGLQLNLAGSSNWPAASCFDVFYASVSGTLYFGTGPAWTTCAGASAARGYSLARYNGIPVNAATMTLRFGASSTVSVPQYQATYLGTIATDAATAGQVTFQFGTAAQGGGQAILNVWNYWDRKLVTTDVNGAFLATFNSNIAEGYKTCFDSATYRVNFLSGMAEDSIYFSLNLYGGAINNTDANGASSGGGFVMDIGTNPLVPAPPYTIQPYLDAYSDSTNYSTNVSTSPHTYPSSFVYTPRIGTHFVQCYAGNDGPWLVSTYETGGGVGDLIMQFRM